MGLDPWLMSATLLRAVSALPVFLDELPGTHRIFWMMLGELACKTSSSMSATPVSMSGLTNPHTMPIKLFIHSTDSGIRLLMAISPRFFSDSQSTDFASCITPCAQYQTALATRVPIMPEIQMEDPPSIFPSTAMTVKIPMHRPLTFCSKPAKTVFSRDSDGV